MATTLETLILEFQVDTTALDGLDTAIQVLEKTGQVEKGVSETLKKTVAAYSERQKAAAAASAVQKQMNENSAAGVKSAKELSDALNGVAVNLAKAGAGDLAEGITEGIRDALQESGILVDGFEQKVEKGFTNAQVPTKTLKAQLREMKEELSRLEDQGKDNTREFETIAVAAAKLEDQIGDTNARIRALASDTRQLDTMVGVVRGIAASFAAAQGAAGLFASENEDLQKALLKVQSAMAILTGLQEIQNLTQKDSIVVQQISILQRRAAALSVELETAAESKNVIVKYAAIAAQRILNAVMAANPGILLLTTIVGLTAAFVAFSSSTEDAAISQEKQNEQTKEQIEGLKELNTELKKISDANVSAKEKELALNEATDGPLRNRQLLERDIAAEKIRNAQNTLKAYTQEFGSIEQLNSALLTQSQLLILAQESGQGEKAIKNIQDQISLTKEKIGLIQGATSAVTSETNAFDVLFASQNKDNREVARNNALAEVNARLLEVKKGTNEELRLKNELVNKERDNALAEIGNDAAREGERLLIIAQAKKSILDNNREFLLQQLSDQKSADEARLAQTVKASKDELDVKIKLIDDERNIQLNQANLSAQEKARIIAQTERQISELRTQFAEEEVAASIQVEQNDAERRLALANAGSAAELQAKQDLVTAQEELDIQEVRNSVKSTEQKTAAIASIEARARNERHKLDQDFNKRKLDDEVETANQILQLQNAELNRQVSNPQATVEAKKQANDQILANEKKMLQNVQDSKLDMFFRGIISEKEYNDALLNIQLARIKAATDADNRAAQQIIENQQKVKDFVFQSVTEIINFQFALDNQDREDSTNAKLRSLNKQREAELNNKKLTEDQKAKVDEKYRAQEANIKQQAFKNQQEADIEQAIINGAVGVTKVLASVGDPVSRATQIAATLLITATQVGIIASKKVPEYRYGTEYVGDSLFNDQHRHFMRGPGTTWNDKIDAKLSVGERVVDYETNMLYWPALNAIQTGKVDPDYANKILTGVFMFPELPVPKLQTVSDYRGVDPAVERVLSPVGATINEDRLAQKMAYNLMGVLSPLKDNIHYSRQSTEYLRQIAEKPSESPVRERDLRKQ